MTLVYITMAWSMGVLLARVLAYHPWMLAAVSGMGATCWLGMRGRRRLLTAALVVAACLGAARHWLAEPRIHEGHLARYNETGWVCMEGYVSAEPSVRDTYTQLELFAQSIKGDGGRHPVTGKVVVNVPHYPEYAYGMRVRLCGFLETPPVFEDFSYREYLAAKGVLSIARRVKIEPLQGRDGNSVLRHIYAAKGNLRRVIEAILPDPDAGLLSGILLGLGHTLPDYVYDAFRATGLTHIIVISGFNISLVSQSVICCTRRLLRRRVALLTSMGAIALYAVFVGPSPPVARAALMGALFVLGQLVGRPIHLPTSLAFATLIMTAANPLLVASVSFQLSFVATLALIAIEPAMARRLYGWMVSWAGGDRAREWLRVLRDVFMVTLAAQLMTLPIVWYHFGEVSLVSLVANALVLFVQPALMLFGFVATILGAIWWPAGRVAAWLAWPFLRYSIVVVQYLARVPWAMARLPHIGALGAVGLFGILFALFTVNWQDLWERIREVSRKALYGFAGVAALTLVTVLVWAAVRYLPDGKLHLYALDVGQGDAILIRSPGGRTILVDGGPDPLTLTSRLGQVLPFWDRSVDIVVATHADRDHLAGLLPIVERYDVSYVIESPVMGDCDLVRQWNALIEASDAQCFVAQRGMRITLDDLAIEVVHPDVPIHGSGDDDNRNSVVLNLSMGRCRVLLTGDIDREIERQLVARDHESSLRACILKVPHHGASASSSAAFIDAVAPQIAIVSVGSDNEYGHPGPDVLERLSESGCRVLRTDQAGTVHLASDGHALWVSTTYRSGIKDQPVGN